LFDVERARRLMGDLDGILIFSPENFYYTSGFPSRLLYLMRIAGISVGIIPKESEPVVVVTSHEADVAEKESRIKSIRSYTPVGYASCGSLDVVLQILKEKELMKGRLGIELDFVPYQLYEKLKRLLPNVEFEDVTLIFQQLRKVKTPEEIEKLRRAVKITEKGIARVAEVAREGVSEFEITKEFRNVVAVSDCWRLRYAMITVGELAAGAFPSSYELRNGDLLQLDVGVDVEGYTSDLGRTFAIGPPSQKQKRIYRCLLQGQRKVAQAMKPGIKFSDIYKIGLQAIRDAGYSEFSPSNFGHSIGLSLAVEEEPFISPSENSMLCPGMVLTAEVPYAFYQNNRHSWGMQIEDIVLITEDGHEELSSISRDLLEL
jgi:Xaa-Pro aminopeptidase